MGYALFDLYRIRQTIKRLRMARDGEKAVGQYLSDLREQGCRVYHDVIGQGFNIDHVIICDRGIFTIETKTYSKPASGRSTIQFDVRPHYSQLTRPLILLNLNVEAALQYRF